MDEYLLSTYKVPRFMLQTEMYTKKVKRKMMKKNNEVQFSPKTCNHF